MTWNGIPAWRRCGPPRRADFVIALTLSTIGFGVA
jgi:hypothetical protein